MFSGFCQNAVQAVAATAAIPGDTTAIQPRYSRDTAAVQPRYSHDSGRAEVPQMTHPPQRGCYRTACPASLSRPARAAALRSSFFAF